MRIGVLTTSYPRSDDDPAGAFVAGFSRWLAAHVGDVEVIAADESSPLFYRGGAPHALSSASAWLQAAAFSSRLLAHALVRARRWDAIVSHWLVPSGAIGAALARGRPHLTIAHGSDVRLLACLPGGPSLLRAIARTSDLVYVSRALAVDGAPGRVVPMGIDTSAFLPSAVSRETGFTVLCLARLIRDKGVELAIDALPDDATLLIAGEGPERGALEAYARGRRVQFLGEVRGADKRALLTSADVLIVPSRTDGAPTVLLEGLAAGLPIVATRAGGIPELVRDGETALLCATEAPALRAALIRIQNDRALADRLRKSALREAARHDWREVGPRLWGREFTPRQGHVVLARA